jgi:hypothetical protein
MLPKHLFEEQLKSVMCADVVPPKSRDAELEDRDREKNKEKAPTPPVESEY